MLQLFGLVIIFQMTIKLTARLKRYDAETRGLCAKLAIAYPRNATAIGYRQATMMMLWQILALRVMRCRVFEARHDHGWRMSIDFAGGGYGKDGIA